MSLHHTSDELCPLCEQKISEAHHELQRLWKMIKAKFPDAHISWAFRDEAAQNVFFNMGKTKARWPNSAHNKQPARAIDLFQVRPDKVAAWPEAWFKSISDFLDASEALITWGGKWKLESHGKHFSDGDHFELHKEVL